MFVFYQGVRFLGFAPTKVIAEKMGKSLSEDGSEIRCEKNDVIIGYFRNGKFFKV